MTKPAHQSLPAERSEPAEPGRVTVLVVDDDPTFHLTIGRFLGGYRRLTAYNGWQALELLGRHHVDVVLLDLGLPDQPGLDVLGRIRAAHEDVEVIIITSAADIKLAVAAGKAGAFDFLAKSWESYQQLGLLIDRALENRRRRHADILARADEVVAESIAQLQASRSPDVREVLRVLTQVAPTPLTVLLEGESGVGKELLARYLHLCSDRSAGAFVPVNLAAVPTTLIDATLFGHERGAFTGADRRRLGKFELADGGTLFLDEVGELEPSAQIRLLRVLQERVVERLGAAEPVPVNVRVVAATNKDLERAVVEGTFRGDLFYRLNAVRLTMPPLRWRRGDIPELVSLLARRASRAMRREPPTFDREALRALRAYSWPGNVRELENLVARLTALHPGGKLGLAALPIEYCVEHLGRLAVWQARQDSQRLSLYELATGHFERYFVRHMVERCDGNMAEAARRLGVSYTTVKKKMYGLDPTTDDDEE